MFQLDCFISKHVLKREKSLFENDIIKNYETIYKNIHDKSILVIGGAGSIGSSFIKSLLPYGPRTLIVADINENALTELSRDLRSSNLPVPDDYIPYPINFSDKIFKKIFSFRNSFDIIANFSAHKHVRSEKDIFSVEAILRNNVLNLDELLNLLTKHSPRKFFCVSTDKAANPVNIMGASKKIMEDLLFSFSDKFSVSTARFANVAFSNGSLPAGFLERISKLQPISAPSDIRRYFVSPKESGELCLLACMLGNNREIFFPKLENYQVMTFSDIAILLLKEFGFTPKIYDSAEDAIAASEFLKKGGHEFPVYFSRSDTTGEKEIEEFYTDTETVDLNRFTSLGVITNVETYYRNNINKLLKQLNDIFDRTNCTKTDVIEILEEYLPDFNHKETGKYLDSKM